MTLRGHVAGPAASPNSRVKAGSLTSAGTENVVEISGGGCGDTARTPSARVTLEYTGTAPVPDEAPR